MSNWLAETLQQCHLTEEVEGYLLGRGAREESYRSLGVVTWQIPYDKPPEDAAFLKRYGPPRGLNLEGWLICPILSPRGRVIGFEGRDTQKKSLTEFLLPEAQWNPVWLGLTPEVMEKLWCGGDLWVTEGLFDKFPLEWIVPKTDAVLATLRARMSDRLVEFIRRFCRGWVHMVYDLDDTGRKATHGWVDQKGKRIWGALEKLNRAGVPCRDVSYSGGTDPGDVWDRGGLEALRSAFSL